MGAPDAETGFSLSYELTLDDIGDLVAGSQLLRRRRASARGQLALVILAAAAWTAFTVLPNFPSLRASRGPGWLYAVDAAAWIYLARCCYVVWHLSLKQLARRTWRARQHGRYLTEVNPHGVSVVAPDGSERFIPWSAITGFRESDQSFYLLGRKGITVNELPKRGLQNAELIASLRDFLDSSVGRQAAARERTT
jgi:YcxB-like protein